MPHPTSSSFLHRLCLHRLFLAAFILTVLCVGSFATAQSLPAAGNTEVGLPKDLSGGMMLHRTLPDVGGTLLIDPGTGNLLCSSYERLRKFDPVTLAVVDTLNVFATNLALCSTLIDPVTSQLFYFVSGSPARVIQIDIPSLSSVGSITLDSREKNAGPAAIDVSSGRAILCAQPYYVLLNLRPLQRIRHAMYTNLDQPALAKGGFFDAGSNQAYFPTAGPGRIISVSITNAYPMPHGVPFNFGYHPALYDPGTGTAYLTLETNPVTIRRFPVPDFAAISSATLPFPTVALAALDPHHSAAYYVTAEKPPVIHRVNTNTLSWEGSLALPASIVSCSSIALDPSAGRLFLAASLSSRLVLLEILLNQTPAHVVRGSRLTMPEPGIAEAFYHYQHAAQPHLRLGLYHELSETTRTLVWQSADTSSTLANAWQRIPVSAGVPASLRLPMGTYFLAWQTSGTTVTASHVIGEPAEGMLFPSSFGPLPPQLDLQGGRIWFESRDRWSGYLEYRTQSAVPSLAWLHYGEEH